MSDDAPPPIAADSPLAPPPAQPREAGAESSLAPPPAQPREAGGGSSSLEPPPAQRGGASLEPPPAQRGGASLEPPPAQPREGGGPSSLEPPPAQPREGGGPSSLEPPPAKRGEAGGGSSGLALTVKLSLILVSPLLALLAIAALPRRIDLWAVNGGAGPIEVQVADRTLELRPFTAQHLSGLDAGQLSLRWTEGGQPRHTVVRADADLFAPRRTWVWNVGGHTPRFWIVSRGYGDATAPAPEPVQVETVWRLPADLLGEVDRPLPERAQDVRPGVTGVVLRALWSEHHAQSIQPARVRLLIDNGATVQVRLRVDGRDQPPIPPRSVGRVEGLPPGEHRLEVTALAPGGGEGQVVTCTATLTAEPLSLPAGWVWRPWGGGDPYWVVSQGMGELEAPLPPPERLPSITGDLFRIPAGVEPGLDEPPGLTRVPRGAKGVILRSLWTARQVRNALAEPPRAAAPQGFSLQELFDKVRQEGPQQDGVQRREEEGQ